MYTVPVRLLWNGGPLTFSDLHHVLTSFNICFGVYIKQQCHSDITDKKVIEISLFVFHFSSFIKRVPSCPFYYLLSIMMVKRTCKQTIVKISFVKNQDFFPMPLRTMVRLGHCRLQMYSHWCVDVIFIVKKHSQSPLVNVMFWWKW